MGHGLKVLATPDGPVFGHEGHMADFDSAAYYHPHQDMSVVALSSTTNAPATQIASKLARTAAGMP